MSVKPLNSQVYFSGGPVDGRTVVATEANITSISNAYVGMGVTVLNNGSPKKYTIKKLTILGKPDTKANGGYEEDIDTIGAASKESVNIIADKLDKLPNGMYYGQYSSVENLPAISTLEQKGYAYVSSVEPNVYYIYLYNGDGEEWQDSGNKFVTTELETNLSTKSQTKAPTTKAVKEGIEAVDVTTEQEFSSIQKETARTNIGAQENITTMQNVQPIVSALNDREANVNQQTSEVKALGYKVLNPALSFASQVTTANTIYEIRDNFVLDTDNTITIPDNSTLFFNGGRIEGGIIALNGCLLDGNPLILGASLSGMIANSQITPQVFGAKGDGESDDTAAIRTALRVCNYVTVPNGRYGITQYPASGYLGYYQTASGRALENAICITRDNVTLHLDDGAEIFVKNIVDESSAAASNTFVCSIYILGTLVLSNGVLTSYATIKNITIEGGSFVGNRGMFTYEDYAQYSRENYAGIACCWVDGLTIKNTKITDNSGDALYCAPTWNTLIENVETARNRRTSIGIGVTDKFKITNCYFHDEKQPFSYDNGNSNTGLTTNGIIVIEPEPHPLVLYLGNETVKNIEISNNLYNAGSWALFFKGGCKHLKISNNTIINSQRRAAIINITPTGSSDTKATYSIEDVEVSKNTIECVGFTSFYKNTSNVWLTNKYYSKSGDVYTLLNSQPSGWSTNYGNYYYLSVPYVANSSPTWATNKFYTKISNNEYSLVTSKPANWDETFTNYFVVSSWQLYAIIINVDGNITVKDNTVTGIGLCDFYKTKGNVYIVGNTNDWYFFCMFGNRADVLSADKIVFESNEVKCNVFLNGGFTTFTNKYDCRLLFITNTIRSHDTIAEDAYLFRPIPVVSVVFSDNDIISNTMWLFPPSYGQSTMDITNNYVESICKRPTIFYPFGQGSSSNYFFNGKLVGNTFKFPAKIAKLSNTSSNKLIYEGNTFIDSYNDEPILNIYKQIYDGGNVYLAQSIISKIGTSADRPNSPNISFCYYDTTFNKPIYWNGTSWTDANGETVGLQVNDTSMLIAAAQNSSKTINVYSASAITAVSQVIDETSITYTTGSTADTIESTSYYAGSAISLNEGDIIRIDGTAVILNSSKDAIVAFTSGKSYIASGTETIYIATTTADTDVVYIKGNWLEASVGTASGSTYPVTLKALSANSTAPRGAKVIITNNSEVVIINVVQSY